MCRTALNLTEHVLPFARGEFRDLGALQAVDSRRPSARFSGMSPIMALKKRAELAPIAAKAQALPSFSGEL